MPTDLFGWLLVLTPALTGVVCLYFGIQFLRPSRSTAEDWPRHRALGCLGLGLSLVCVCLTGLALLVSMALTVCAGIGTGGQAR